jgi:hypothetical protein
MNSRKNDFNNDNNILKEALNEFNYLEDDENNNIYNEYLQNENNYQTMQEVGNKKKENNLNIFPNDINKENDEEEILMNNNDKNMYNNEEYFQEKEEGMEGEGLQEGIGQGEYDYEEEMDLNQMNMQNFQRYEDEGQYDGNVEIKDLNYNQNNNMIDNNDEYEYNLNDINHINDNMNNDDDDNNYGIKIEDDLEEAGEEKQLLKGEEDYIYNNAYNMDNNNFNDMKNAKNTNNKNELNDNKIYNIN